MNQPEGFETNSGLVCKLKKSLYGLKQSCRIWNETFVEFLKQFDLEPICKDNCILRRKADDDKTLIIAIYVDDGPVLTTSVCLTLS